MNSELLLFSISCPLLKRQLPSEVTEIQLSCCAVLQLCVAILNSAKPWELKRINTLKPQILELGQKPVLFIGLKRLLSIYQ